MSFTRVFVTHLFLLAFCGQMLVPAGYMADDIGDGWHLQLCPDGLSQATLSKLLGHHHHHHSPSDSPSTCELGSFSWESTTSAPTDLNLEATVNGEYAGALTQPTPYQPLRKNHSRAPPLS